MSNPEPEPTVDPMFCQHYGAKSMGNKLVIQDDMYDPNDQLDVIDSGTGTPLSVNGATFVVRKQGAARNKLYELHACPDCGAAVWKRVD